MGVLDEFIETTDNLLEEINRVLYETAPLKGKVVDKLTGYSIENVDVKIFKTMVRITKDNYACFEEPDTTSTKITKLKSGDYPALEIKLNHPTIDTDYVKVKFEASENNEGWICSKWKDTDEKINHTALLFDGELYGREIRTSQDGSFSINVHEMQLYKVRFILKNYFDAESERILPSGENIEIEMEWAPNNVQEFYIVNRLKDFKNFSYDLDNPRYPYTLPNVNVPQTPPKKNNCCTFVEGLLVKAWKDVLERNFNWNLNKHNQMMITSKEDYYSPVTAVIESNMAIEIDINTLPPAWTIVQGWKSEWKRGHTFLIVGIHPETERVLTLESNNYFGMDGPGFRELGDLDKYLNPGKDWWKKVTLWDWDRFKARFPYRKMARLKVYDINWVQ